MTLSVHLCNALTNIKIVCQFGVQLFIADIGVLIDNPDVDGAGDEITDTLDWPPSTD
jgi:hypothetical protein